MLSNLEHTWPRELPLDAKPENVHKIVQDYSYWMKKNIIPKLFINANPGSILVGPQREFCRKWKNQKEITVEGYHFIQEDSPKEIGSGIADFLDELSQ